MKFKAVLSICLIIVFPNISEAKDSNHTVREEYTCRDEEKFFSSWQRIAGSVNEDLLKQKNVELTQLTVSDQRVLRGIHVKSENKKEVAVLVMQGNSWLADDFLDYVSTFTLNGIDVFLFDYRGYGLSKPGNASLKAIIEDYKEIGQWLKRKPYDKLFLYAFSFGGVVAAHAFKYESPFFKTVMDSVPSRPSKVLGVECSVSYSPIDSILQPCSDLTFMHGTSDWVVGRKSTEELIRHIKNCGGTLNIDKWRGHPFQIEWDSTSRARIRDVITHFGIDLINNP